MNQDATSLALNRREFLALPLITGLSLSSLPALAADDAIPIKPSGLIGDLKQEDSATPISDAIGYTASQKGQGVEYRFDKGLLAGQKYLMADFLVDGKFLVVFHLYLQEGENGPTFRLQFKGLNQCGARIRLPLEALNLNRWMLSREGAWLKPICGGQRVDLSQVDRMRLVVTSKSEEPSRWCITPFIASVAEPLPQQTPILPKGPLLDEFGQSAIHDWAQKTKDEAELAARLNEQSQTAPHQKWPEGFSQWGGDQSVKWDATGYFRTHHDGKRWWLVDPDGHPFWSTGMDCVRVDGAAYYKGIRNTLSWIPNDDPLFRQAVNPNSVNYLSINFMRVFREDWHAKWAEIALGQLRDFGFNTVANWSEWEIAKAAQMPYVRPLSFRFEKTPLIYRDFPDVFSPSFTEEAANRANQLQETKDDPAFIGYFLMNEPTWGFAEETPAAGMMFNTRECETRKALAEHLQKKYGDAAALAKAWDMETTFAAIAQDPWSLRFTKAAEKDLAEFSEIMVIRFFQTLTEACRKVDPHHLNLGVRYHTVPPSWAMEGMKTFDVFSMNCYRDKIPVKEVATIAQSMNMPVMIGEYHFGALDVGLSSPGLRHVRTQEARGQAYRYYTEDAAANPYCVGTHYFTLYDQSALGRNDGENYNIGFLDLCNKPYESLVNAARETHRRIYSIAQGQEKPYSQAPEFLPNLF